VRILRGIQWMFGGKRGTGRAKVVFQKFLKFRNTENTKEKEKE
jgi:hypothetical protein